MPIDVRVEGIEQLSKAHTVFSESRKWLKPLLLQASKDFGLDSVARSKKDYLSGPRPNKLGRVTGRLASSITTETRDEGKDISTEIGTNVIYARPWEYGFKGVVSIPAHTRLLTKVFGKPITNKRVKVRAHTMNVNMRAKPFLQPAINDALPAFEEKIADALASISTRK